MIDRFTAKAKEAIGLAVDAAEELGRSYVGTEHLLLGLLREGSGVAARVLMENGVEEKKVLSLISQLIAPDNTIGLAEQAPDGQLKIVIGKRSALKRRLSAPNICCLQ